MGKKKHKYFERCRLDVNESKRFLPHHDHEFHGRNCENVTFEFILRRFYRRVTRYSFGIIRRYLYICICVSNGNYDLMCRTSIIFIDFKFCWNKKNQLNQFVPAF